MDNLHSLKVPSHKIQWRNLAEITLINWFMLMKQTKIVSLLTGFTETDMTTFVVSLSKMHALNLIMRKHQGNPNWRHAKNNRPVILKSVKVKRVEERQKNCSKVKTKEIGLPNAARDPELNPFATKGCLLGKLVKLEMGSQDQFSSVTQSYPTLWDPMDCSTPSLPVHHQPLEFTQTHVHWVGDAI